MPSHPVANQEEQEVQEVKDRFNGDDEMISRCVVCGRFAPSGMDKCWSCAQKEADKYWDEEGHKLFDKDGNRIRKLAQMKEHLM